MFIRKNDSQNLFHSSVKGCNADHPLIGITYKAMQLYNATPS